MPKFSCHSYSECEILGNRLEFLGYIPAHAPVVLADRFDAERMDVFSAGFGVAS